LPQVLAQLGISRPVLVGHSDGATIALLHAARHDVAGCVAMAPHVFVEAMSLTAIAQAKHLYQSDPGATGSLRQRLARHHKDVDNAFWQWNDVWLSDAFRTFDIRAEIRSIAAPLMLVQGMDDEYGSMEQLRTVETASAEVIRLALNQCGHSPHRDQPDRLTEAVQCFLAHLV
jgi:pimeloyl-ACP methyl ester carboxylesterase